MVSGNGLGHWGGCWVGVVSGAGLGHWVGGGGVLGRGGELDWGGGWWVEVVMSWAGLGYWY